MQGGPHGYFAGAATADACGELLPAAVPIDGVTVADLFSDAECDDVDDLFAATELQRHERHLRDSGLADRVARRLEQQGFSDAVASPTLCGGVSGHRTTHTVIRGRCVAFRHDWPHDGAEVGAGGKRILKH
eukprot:gene39120-41996_t